MIVILVFSKSFKRPIVKRKVRFDVNGYSVFYQDKKSDDINIITSKMLYSEKYMLKGKPDYILKSNNSEKYIPIELKSGYIKDDTYPHMGDLLQLITYFIIIEEEFLQRPKYGKLIYNDYMFIVKNTKAHRKMVLKTVKDMRKMLKTGKAKNVEPSFMKCKYCVCNNSVCEEV